MKSLTLYIIFLSTVISLYAQNGIVFNSANATNGYTLFTNTSKTYLVNNCGKIVNTWNVNNVDNHCKLLPNGNLLYSKNNSIYEVDWNGNQKNAVSLQDNDLSLDYEVIKLPNENYLCVARRETTLEELKSYGYDISGTSPGVTDAVVELDGKTGKTLWRWNIIDHLIQEKYPSKKAYAVIKDHPERLDVNAIATYDWQNYESFMINGMDYNADLDQIVLSVRKLCEVVIIDHSTTTAQAAGKSGGRYGKGGDILYRYGNPRNYKRGSTSDQSLFFQHNPNWILEGEHKGKIMIFNNNLSAKNYSAIEIISPPINPDGTYIINNDQPYMPLHPEIEYSKISNNINFESGYTSGAKVLPNGNIYITVGKYSKGIEIDKEGKIVWEYNFPSSYYIFRTERYASDYKAFEGKSLEPLGTVENPPSTYNCFISETEDIKSNEITIQYSDNEILVKGISEQFNYSIYSLSGMLIKKGESATSIPFDQDIKSGIIILKIQSQNHYLIKKILAQSLN